MFFGRMMTIILICCSLYSIRLNGETIKLGNGEYPPYTSQGFKEYGYWSKLVSDAFKEEGITVEYGFFPWKRALESAKAGAIDGVIGFSKTSERELSFIYPESSLGDGRVVFYHNKDLKFAWKDVKELEKFSIGGMRGYATYEEMIALNKEGSKLNLLEATDEQQVFKLVLARRVDLFPAVEEVGNYILLKHFTQGERDRITYHQKPWKVKPIYVIFPKAKQAQSHRLLKLFEAGLKKLKDSGKYQVLQKEFNDGKYFE